VGEARPIEVYDLNLIFRMHTYIHTYIRLYAYKYTVGKLIFGNVIVLSFGTDLGSNGQRQ
jgi:hypothetical protein